ncbi:hypothetical protein [Roseovarius ramblicola]|uniref:DUF2924 domain-containing protein n=1 Tax=Roseovarius ramblicola TaxID=2022336 RepID=A0ABV5I4Q4_9RHOB
MNRTIPVSTDVFAAIWSHRQEGEETEDAILRRILDCQPVAGTDAKSQAADIGEGFFDRRNNVTFPPGFTIFRTYKRKQYSAVAENGVWRRTDTGRNYETLNQLNASIAAGNENVWNGNWKFQDSDGTIKSIAALRD